MYRELCFRGRLISLYNGIVYYNPSDLDIDHMYLSAGRGSTAQRYV